MANKTEETPKLPYLAIRNWAKWQSTTDKNGKSLEGRRRDYIRDYCDKETDSQYAALSVTARYLFDACRRLKGKTGRNLPNDHMWILRQLDVDPTERGRCTHALQALITRGLLVPTNEQLSVPQAASGSLPLPLEVPLELKGNDNGNGSADTAEELTGIDQDQEPNLGETPNPQVDTLTAILDSDNHPAWFRTLMSESVETRRKVMSVAEWVDTKSTFWKDKPCLGLGGYRAMESSYDKFYAKVPVGKKPHDLIASKAKAADPEITGTFIITDDFKTEVSADLATLVEGQVDVEGIDEVPVRKSRVFQIED